MHCPFLNEEEVRYCGISPFRKMLPNTGRSPEDEKCSSPAFVSCPLAAGRPEIKESASSCPFLRKSLVQFCSAAPATHFIPYSDTLLSCCQSDGHRYCDLYLAQAEPDRSEADHGPPDADEAVGVDGIELPHELAYAPNHMWINVSEDGSCHVGVDAFLVKVIGKVDRVSFVAARTTCCPTAVLRVCGVDLTLVFPEQVELSRANVHLRSHPERVVEDPYGRGWLFEGRANVDARSGNGTPAALYRGQDACAWMKAETDRLSRFVHETYAVAGPDGRPLLNDGGSFCAPVVPHLAPEDRMLLFNTFFSLGSSWRPS
jgi:glycine cleavage system H lipoate-binding protein